MKRGIGIIMLAAALGGCGMMGGGSTQGPLGSAVVCDADADQFCTGDRCRPIERGVRLSTPLSITIPARAEVGRACVATGCEDAFFYSLEASSPQWKAEVRTGPQWSRPMGEITIEMVRWNFELRQAASDGETVWTGACRAQGS